MCNFHIKLGDNWYKTDNVFVTGAGFIASDFKRDEALKAWFEVDSWHNFVNRVKQLNGFFAVVVRHKSECYAAVDRVRSIPLFYAIGEDTFYLSDDPKWIQNQLSGEDIDPTSVAEFLLTGYVTGNYTLNRRIRQLQAGEALRVVTDENGLSVQSERYYQFITGRGEDCTSSESDLLHKLDEVTVAAIERLIRVVNGRPIVIPLSGGLDSRLIAMTLRRLGYKNIIAFSYGVKGNWESKVSQKVANQLGIPWHFVEYNRALWRKWYWSDECQEYIKYASRLVSLAHLQDWPAVMELKRNGVIPEEALIVPGHTGDFISGGHIPSELTQERVSGKDNVIDAIWHHHYILMPITMASNYARMNPLDGRSALLARLKAYFKDFPEAGLKASQAIGLYEAWEWAERQAKYIVNSVRVYDFFGLRWWLPWWDAEFMMFWEYAPLRLRFDRKLYRHYVYHIAEEVNLPREPDMSIIRKVKHAVKSVAKICLLNGVYKNIRQKIGAQGLASPILAFDGAFDLRSERGVSVQGLAALAQLVARQVYIWGSELPTCRACRPTKLRLTDH